MPEGDFKLCSRNFQHPLPVQEGLKTSLENPFTAPRLVFSLSSSFGGQAAAAAVAATLETYPAASPEWISAVGYNSHSAL